MTDRGSLTFLLAGGSNMRTKKVADPLLQEVFRQTGSKKPTVAYVGAASGDNEEFRLWLTKLFQKSGACEVKPAPLCGRKDDPEKAKAILEASDIIFLSGGDVEEGMRIIKEKKMTDVLRRLHRMGKPFFGLSAGSIMLAERWIRWTDPDDDKSAELFDCLGFASVLCDTHGEEDGWEELKALLALSSDGTLGYGIVSRTALIVRPGGVVSALGGEVHRFKKQAGKVIQTESLFPETCPQ